MIVAAGKFKAHCLKMMDEVRDKHVSIVITKHGKPCAKLVPIDEENVPLFGCMKGRIQIEGDVVAPTGEEWHADG